MTIVLRPGNANVVEPIMAAIVEGATEMALAAPERELAEDMLADYRSALEITSNDIAQLRGVLGRAGEVNQAPAGSGPGDGYTALAGLQRSELDWKLAIRNLESKLQALPDGTIVSPITVETTAQPRNIAMPVVLSAVAGFVLAAFIAMVRDAWRRAATSPGTSEKVARIRHAFGRRCRSWPQTQRTNHPCCSPFVCISGR